VRNLTTLKVTVYLSAITRNFSNRGR